MDASSSAAPSRRVCTALRRRLLSWYRSAARSLPFRETRDPYRVWIAEIILQQTRVETGVAYYERFVRAFPTVAALARADLDAVLKHWEGLGYYNRARNLHRAARTVVDGGGTLPATAAEWRALRGVGRYTAGAIASIAAGESVPAVDGNVKRVLARLFAIEACIDDTATTERLWELAGTLVPARGAGDFNQALMELGACICLPRAPRCAACPVGTLCAARDREMTGCLPVRRARKPVPHRAVAVALLERQGRLLLGQRPAGGMLAGLWELPGGTVRPGESPGAALRRICRLEIGFAPSVGERLAVVEHAYSHFTLTASLYRAAAPARSRAQAHHHTALAWVHRRALSRYALPTVDRKLLAGLIPS